VALCARGGFDGVCDRAASRPAHPALENLGRLAVMAWRPREPLGVYPPRITVVTTDEPTQRTEGIAGPLAGLRRRPPHGAQPRSRSRSGPLAAGPAQPSSESGCDEIVRWAPAHRIALVAAAVTSSGAER
jgi:hypothetical protein